MGKRSLAGVRALNAPRPLEMRTADDGRPAAVRLKRAWCAVAEVTDTWRIDDEWWRERPVSRLYHRVALEDGTMVVVFRDLVDDTWWRQRA